MGMLPIAEPPLVEDIMNSRGNTMAFKTLLDHSGPFWNGDAIAFWETIFQPTYMASHRWEENAGTHTQPFVLGAFSTYITNYVKHSRATKTEQNRFNMRTIRAFAKPIARTILKVRIKGKRSQSNTLSASGWTPAAAGTLELAGKCLYI
jgi:hypothetical protein